MKESTRLLQDHEPLFTLKPHSFLPSVSLPQISSDYIFFFF
ncbi:rCG33833 [Rattus norvegicus]|uniref:RCG33833 n=1 Tax=Rattus norvegicus TaxID=10116 RepID=A6HKF5_RAT|nr:rCG33833 [Rattus norvegicus]